MAAHPIVHVEIPANDPQVASQFYGDVFGWQISVDPTFDYHMFQSEGGPGGGFVKVGTQEGGGASTLKVGEVLVYLGSDDIEADLRNVEAHGGTTIVPKTEIPNTGWFGIFTDPAGNRVALYTPAQRPS